MRPFWNSEHWNIAIRTYLFYCGLWFTGTGTFRFWYGLVHGDMSEHWVWFSRFVAGGIFLGLSSLIKKDRES